MKTLQELFQEVSANDELKKAFIEAGNNDKLNDFLKEHGCDATKEEVVAFLTEKANEDKPLSVEQLEQAAGGGTWTDLVNAIIGNYYPMNPLANGRKP